MWSMRRRIFACFLMTLLSLLTTRTLIFSSPAIRNPKERLEIFVQQLRKSLVWHNRDDTAENYTSIVVFGDSWVDISLSLDGMKRKTWPEVACDEINCTSYVSFAASQPLLDSLNDPPTGVYVSHLIQSTAHMGSDLYFNTSNLLPDLGSQITSYLTNTTPVRTPGITFFVFSVGFWDIYSLANLSPAVSKAMVNQCFEEILTQIGRLHINNRADKLLNTSMTANLLPETRMILPKVLDPSFSPGWLSQRPVPPMPSNIAEQQKNAIYLTEQWNQKLETLQRPWVTTNSTVPTKNSRDGNSSLGVDGHIFTPDFPKLLLKLSLNYYLQKDPTSNTEDIGRGEPIFKSINEPCVQLKGPDERRRKIRYEQKNLELCSQPEKYLWWDAWHLGTVGNAFLGTAEDAVLGI